jgi:cob(I)alamin adenosyltransferase
MRITRVYTRKGDGGETGLGGGQKVGKDSLRVAAYGTVDELNSLLGVARALGLDAALVPLTERLQNELFQAGSDLCLLEEDKKRFRVAGMEARHVALLESDIDRLLEHLPPLKEFILPGGAPGAAQLHVARTVCRRAEREVVALGRKETIGPHIVPYLNRLSDLLFVMARHENRAKGVPEPEWRKEPRAGD